ncbi:MAG: hypothetical protein RLZZ210_1581, partial [Pseudomonadota bacterium]
MIFGIDVGIASVGSCVLELHNQEDNYQGMIKHVGVRLFDAGENAKDGKALNADYREHRGTRKRLRRTKHRKELLQKLFKQYGLIDKVNLSKNKFSLLKPSFILPQDAKHNTWKLRTDGLERALNKEEWASVLYYLVKHRGFQSNSKKEDLKDKETGKALSAISDNQKLLAEKNYQTFGEMLYKDEKYRNRKRNTTNDYANTVNRTMVEDELNKLFDKQAEYNNPYTSL